MVYVGVNHHYWLLAGDMMCRLQVIASFVVAGGGRTDKKNLSLICSAFYGGLTDEWFITKDRH